MNNKFGRNIGFSIVVSIIVIFFIAWLFCELKINKISTQIAIYSAVIAIIAIAISIENHKQNRYESQLRGLIDNFLKISDTSDTFIKEYEKIALKFKTDRQDCTAEKKRLYAEYNLPTFCSRIVLIISHIKNYKDQSLKDEEQWMKIVKSVLTRTDCYKLYYASRCYVCDKEFGKLINDDLLDNLTDSICPKESISKMEWYSIFDIK